MKFTTMDEYLRSEAEMAIAKITNRENVDFDERFVEKHLNNYKGILNQLDFKVESIEHQDEEVHMDMTIYNEGEEVGSIYPIFKELSPGFWVVK